MTHFHRRKTSRNQYFRMDVPKDVQHLAGKTSWQHSLDTADPNLADARRAFYASKYKTEIIRLRAQAAVEIDKRAEAAVGKAFSKLAAHYGSMDRAVSAELGSLAWTVRASWSRDDAHAVERQIFGQEITDEWVGESGPVEPIPAFDIERDQHLFNLRAQLFETREETFGLVYQELARSLLERGLHDALPYQVGCMAYVSTGAQTGPPIGVEQGPLCH